MDRAVFVDSLLMIDSPIAIVLLLSLKHHQPSLHHLEAALSLFGFGGCFSRVLSSIFIVAQLNG